MKNNNMVLGVVLIIGAAMYARSKTAVASTVHAGPASMPGSVGSGTNQVVGGAIGSWLRNVFAPTPAGAVIQSNNLSPAVSAVGDIVVQNPGAIWDDPSTTTQTLENADVLQNMMSFGL